MTELKAHNNQPSQAGHLFSPPAIFPPHQVRDSALRCPRNFSMLEMFLVIIAAGILMGVTIPVLQRLASGTGVNAAGRMLSSDLRLARRFSLTHRRRVAVIMPGPNASSVPVNNRFTTTRLAYVRENNPPNLYEFESWVENFQWNFLTAGISIMECDDDIGIADGANFVRDPVHNNFTKVDAVPLAGIGGSTQNGIRAVVFSATGKILGSSRFITVGEASFIGGVWVIRNAATQPTNISTPNQITFLMNLYTGAFSVQEPHEY